jgi:carbon-monoxide dehydrogenase medium subunit
VKPAPFDYAAPLTVDEALALLAANPRGAKVLAGGQSLVPLLNLRLSRPELLVDVGRIADGHRVDNSNGVLRVGFGVTQAELLADERAHPLVRSALAHVGHPQTRNRGTVAGSLAHADPAAELPAVAVALDAVLEARSVRGTRRLPASEFFLGPYQTALEEDELLTAVELPRPAGEVALFREVSSGHGDFATAGLVTVARVANGEPVELRLVGFAATPRPVRLHEAERAALEDPERVREAVLESLPGRDLRHHQLAVLAERSIEELAA